MRDFTVPRTLAARLRRLKEFGLYGLKTGTEVEDMDFAEIGLMNELAGSVKVPLIVKIGGPEARNDMRRLKAIGTAGILAPMVESVYGLKNFIGALQDIYGPKGFTELYKAVNIETVTAFANFDGMLDSRAFASIDHVTVGRGDLAASMNLEVPDAEVMQVTRTIVTKARRHGKITSVGGKLTPAGAEALVKEAGPDHFNTRHVMLKAGALAAHGVEEALFFETELYEWLADKFPDKSLAYTRRIKINRERMARRSYRPATGAQGVETIK